MSFKRSVALLFLAAGLVAQPGELRSQLAIPLVLEARAGYAVPMFDDEELAFEAKAGPSFAIGGRVDFLPSVGIFGAYHQARFGCDGCGELDLDQTIVGHGAEGGIHVTLPHTLVAEPWLRGGLTYESLRFTSGSDRMSSNQELGFTVSGGAAVEVVPRIRLTPGVRYFSAPAGFDFSFAPDISTSMAGLAIEIGIAVEL